MKTKTIIILVSYAICCGILLASDDVGTGGSGKPTGDNNYVYKPVEIPTPGSYGAVNIEVFDDPNSGLVIVCVGKGSNNNNNRSSRGFENFKIGTGIGSNSEIIDERYVFGPNMPIYFGAQYTDIYNERSFSLDILDTSNVNYVHYAYKIPDPALYGYLYWEWYNVWYGWQTMPESMQADEGVWTAKWFDQGYNVSTKNYTVMYELTDHKMSKSMVNNEPQNISYEFLVTDYAAYSWLRFENYASFINTDDVKWIWYGPSGYTDEVTHDIPPPDPPSEWWAYYHAWSCIYIDDFPPANLPGDWRVEVYVKDYSGAYEFKFEETFVIHPYHDIDKKLYSSNNGWILYYDDNNPSNGWHDPGEQYYSVPGSQPFNPDNSCWFASACNLIDFENNHHDYLVWLKDGASESPIKSPWGYTCTCNGNGNAFTFDDTGYPNWAIKHAGEYYQDIKTSSELVAGTWQENPIDWCSQRLNEDRPVSLLIWAGFLNRGAMPGRVDLSARGMYHAITLWKVNTTSKTVVITDSDDYSIGHLGARTLSYDFTNNDWVIYGIYPGWPTVHVNYAVCLDEPPPPPSISAVSPNNGSMAGNTVVQITGDNFTNSSDTTVSFGGASASNVDVTSTTSLTCNTPAHAAGVVDIAVTNSNGSGALPNGFTYNPPPAVLSVIPDNGPESGDTFVHIIGGSFTTASDTTINFDNNSATEVTVLNETEMTCKTPAHASGVVDVEVYNSNGYGKLPNGYTYNPPPEITGIDPDSGPITGGTEVTITGDNFTNIADTIVTFGNENASITDIPDIKTIICITPAHLEGLVSVSVSNSNGSDTLLDSFNYFIPVTIDYISPSQGPIHGGTSVTISGSGFTNISDTTVTFDGIPAEVKQVSPYFVGCETPPHVETIDPIDVIVTNSNGSATLEGCFKYLGDHVHISHIIPDNGSTCGYTIVTLYGSGFYDDEYSTDVLMDGVEVNDAVVHNESKIVFLTNPHAAGWVNLTVINTYGEDTKEKIYEYWDVEIHEIQPKHGTTTGGTKVTIFGEHFLDNWGTAFVTFDDVAATSVIVIDDSEIECTTPAHPQGQVDVRVTNDFGSATLPGSFYYYTGGPYFFVPDDYASIQEAIDAAPVSGGTVLVEPGTYMENIDFLGKEITVRGDGDGYPETYDPDPEATIIDGSGLGPVVVIENIMGQDLVLEGFSITNGMGTNYHGGGVCCIASNPTVRSNLIYGNRSQDDGGGISCRDLASVVIEKNVIRNNIGDLYGGGISCYNSMACINNNFIYDNESKARYGAGGGVSCWGSKIEMKNNTIVGNEAARFGGGLCCYLCQTGSFVLNTILWNNTAPDGKEIKVITGVEPEINYCDIEGGWHTANNLDEDPLFANSAGGDYHLGCTPVNGISPCINRGQDDEAPADDFDGDPRPYMGTVDMGADECTEKHPLEITQFYLSITGGTIDFTLDAGVDYAHRRYVLLGSLSGTIPGYKLPGDRTLPLNWDGFTDLIINYLNNTYFLKFMDELDGNGTGTATLWVPGLSPAWNGHTMSYAYTLYSPFNLVSNPVQVYVGD